MVHVYQTKLRVVPALHAMIAAIQRSTPTVPNAEGNAGRMVQRVERVPPATCAATRHLMPMVRNAEVSAGQVVRFVASGRPVICAAMGLRS